MRPRAPFGLREVTRGGKGGRAGGRAPRAAAAASRRLARQRRAASSRAGKRRAHTEAAKTHTEAAKNPTEAAKKGTEAAKMHTEAALRKFAKKTIRVTLWISGDTGCYMRLVTPLRAPFAAPIAPSHRGGLVQNRPPRHTEGVMLEYRHSWGTAQDAPCWYTVCSVCEG